MTTTVRVAADQQTHPEVVRRPAGIMAAAPFAMALAIGGVVLARHGGDRLTEATRAALVLAWAVAGAVITARRPHERLGPLVLIATVVGGTGGLAAAVLRASTHGAGVPGGVVSVAHLVLPLAVALLPAIGMQVLLCLPDGSCRVSRALIQAGYAVGVGVGLVSWTRRPAMPLWPVGVEAVLALAIGLVGSNRRYRRSVGAERQRLQWFGWALVAATEVTLVTLALRLLAGWPPQGVFIIAAATLTIPVALAVSSSPRLLGQVDRILAHTVSTVGLSGVVVAVYVVVVLGLGRPPTSSERSLLLL
ncbi:MAG: hypothetical protein M3137_09080, partial [Actinomycetota bacterium]|nr:hypothetical protein [Actinomycetota bacterium]